jgi:hypothetical protein
MTILKRILISLPLAAGMGLFMSSVSTLLDSYEAMEEYRAITDPIIDGYASQGQLPEVSSNERIELISDLFFIRTGMNRGSFNSVRIRVYGGLLLIVVGVVVMSRAKDWCEVPDHKKPANTMKKTAEQGGDGDAEEAV